MGLERGLKDRTLLATYKRAIGLFWVDSGQIVGLVRVGLCLFWVDSVQRGQRFGWFSILASSRNKRK